MKRLPAPTFQIHHPVHNPILGNSVSTTQIVPGEPSPEWLLSELLFHTITLCMEAYGNVTAQMLLDSVLSLPASQTDANTFYNRAYDVMSTKYETLHAAFMQTASAEEQTAWARLPDEGDMDGYLKRRDEAMPEAMRIIEVGNFIQQQYLHLQADIRTMTDLAFYGFLFTAINGPDFAALCQDKSLDAATLTLEQKLHTPLDHEALHNALLVKLGH